MGNLNGTVESLKKLHLEIGLYFRIRAYSLSADRLDLLCFAKRVSYIFSFTTIFYKIQATASSLLQWNIDFKEV